MAWESDSLQHDPYSFYVGRGYILQDQIPQPMGINLRPLAALGGPGLPTFRGVASHVGFQE